MLMGERANRKELKKILDELRSGKLECAGKIYRFIGLTSESAQDLEVESQKTLVQVYIERQLEVLYPKAPCLILQDQETNTIEIYMIEKRLRHFIV
jgi:hypothetical protein